MRRIRQICADQPLKELTMSVTTFRTPQDVKHVAASNRIDRPPVVLFVPTIVRLVRRGLARSGKLLTHAVQAIAEGRMQRAAIEVELYRRRYKYSSKNDDDLPVVR
jgi:hypothetical protein